MAAYIPGQCSTTKKLSSPDPPPRCLNVRTKHSFDPPWSPAGLAGLLLLDLILLLLMLKLTVMTGYDLANAQIIMCTSQVVQLI